MRQAILSLCSVFVVVLFSQTGGTQPSMGRTVYISTVKKGSVTHFLERIATPTAQVVFTLEPVPDALDSRKISEGPHQILAVVELPSLNIGRLPGETLRLGRISVVSLPRVQGALAQFVLSTRLTAQLLPTTQSNYPAPFSPAFINYQVSFSPFIAANATQFPVDESFLRQKLSEFSGATPVVIGSDTVTISERKSDQGRKWARAFLAQEYTKLGFRVKVEPYGSRGAANFVAEKPGRDASHYVILSAHMDSVGTPGADDDGAGTISALAIAKALAGSDLKYTLRIVGFDEEELGLVGSKAYAAQLQERKEMSNLVGVFNLEMTAFTKRNDGGFHVIDCNENTSATLTAAVVKAVESGKINLKRVEACTSASDHSTFWKYNKPSIVISENFFGGDGNPCYHRACDKTDILNFDYMVRITKAVGIAVAGVMSSR